MVKVPKWLGFKIYQGVESHRTQNVSCAFSWELVVWGVFLLEFDKRLGLNDEKSEENVQKEYVPTKVKYDQVVLGNIHVDKKMAELWKLNEMIYKLKF